MQFVWHLGIRASPGIERFCRRSNQLCPVISGFLVIALFVDLNRVQTENPRFDVAPRNEPSYRYLLNVDANELDTVLPELLVELRQSLRKCEIVRIDDGDQLRFGAGAPSPIRGKLDRELLANPLLSAAGHWKHESHCMRFESDRCA